MATRLAPMKNDSRLLAAITYVLGLVVGLLIYLLEKEDKWVRFHAIQSIIFHLAWSVVFFVVFIVVWVGAIATMGAGALCMILLFPLVFAVFLANLWFAYRAFKGEYFEIPFGIGAFAARQL